MAEPGTLCRRDPSRIGPMNLPMLAHAASDTPTWMEFVRAIAWPAVALVALVFLAFSDPLQAWLVAVTRRLRKVSAFGVDVELSGEAASQVRQLTEDAFGAYRKRIQNEFDRLVHKYQVDDGMVRLVDQHVRPKLRELGDAEAFRCTVHVEDVLFTETLYQLLDYYPASRGSRGRTKSIRFGIVGKAWRSRTDQVERVSTDPQILIRDWGMTKEQALSAGQGQRSFAAILLHDEHGARVGVVYFDSAEENAFGLRTNEVAEFASTVQLGAGQLGITKALAELSEDLRGRSPFIPIYSIGEPP